MKYTEFKKELFRNSELKKIRKKNQLAYDIANQVLDARMKKGLTQDQLAQKIGTKQPSIARIENGDSVPTLTFLEKIANALDVELTVPSLGLSKFPKSESEKFVIESGATWISKRLELGAVSIKFEIINNAAGTENLYPSGSKECYG